MGLCPRVEKASNVPRTPHVMSLGAPSHYRRDEVLRPSCEAAEGIEEVPWVPPHPWYAPAHVTHTFLKRGDRVDVVEEEDVDPLVKTLKGHVALVNCEI